MPRPEHSGMIDGFMSVQALRRQDGKAERRPPDDPAAPPKPSKPPPPKPARGHTALPTRHELICYACGYGFVVTGRLDKVFCPKCKTRLETGDRRIDGDWSGTIRTVGRVLIGSGAVVSSAHLVATDIRVAGRCRQCRLEPTRFLELDTGADVDPDQLADRRLVVVEDAELAMHTPLRCRSLVLKGAFQADVSLSEGAEVHAGAVFRGRLQSPRLIVHDGAGLHAHLEIRPTEPRDGEPTAAAPDPKPGPVPSPGRPRAASSSTRATARRSRSRSAGR